MSARGRVPPPADPQGAQQWARTRTRSQPGALATGHCVHGAATVERYDLVLFLQCHLIWISQTRYLLELIAADLFHMNRAIRFYAGERHWKQYTSVTHIELCVTEVWLSTIHP